MLVKNGGIILTILQSTLAYSLPQSQNPQPSSYLPGDQNGSFLPSTQPALPTSSALASTANSQTQPPAFIPQPSPSSALVSTEEEETSMATMISVQSSLAPSSYISDPLKATIVVPLPLAQTTSSQIYTSSQADPSSQFTVSSADTTAQASTYTNGGSSGIISPEPSTLAPYTSAQPTTPSSSFVSSSSADTSTIITSQAATESSFVSSEAAATSTIAPVEPTSSLVSSAAAPTSPIVPAESTSSLVFSTAIETSTVFSSEPTSSLVSSAADTASTIVPVERTSSLVSSAAATSSAIVSVEPTSSSPSLYPSSQPPSPSVVSSGVSNEPPTIVPTTEPVTSMLESSAALEPTTSEKPTSLQSTESQTTSSTLAWSVTSSNTFSSVVSSSVQTTSTKVPAFSPFTISAGNSTSSKTSTFKESSSRSSSSNGTSSIPETTSTALRQGPNSTRPASTWSSTEVHSTKKSVSKSSQTTSIPATWKPTESTKPQASEVVFTTTIIIDVTKTITTCWTSYISTPTYTPAVPSTIRSSSDETTTTTTALRSGKSSSPPSMLTSSSQIIRVSTMIIPRPDLGTTITKVITSTIYSYTTKTIYPTGSTAAHSPSVSPASTRVTTSFLTSSSPMVRVSTMIIPRPDLSTTITKVITSTIYSYTTKTIYPKPSTGAHSFPASSEATVTVTEPASVTTVTVSLETTLATSELQTVTLSVRPETTGSVHTSLQTQGHPSVQPFNTTVIPTPSSSIAPITSGSAVISSVSTVASTSMVSNNIFVAVASGAPPPQIASRSDHPVPREGINKTGPVETNKFYANFFLATQNAPTFTHPYSLTWAQGQGAAGSWGLAISQVTRAQTVYGPGSPPDYYINPLGIQSMILSARELGASTTLTTSSLTGFSVNVNLSPSSGAPAVITFPLLQGMALITGVYSNGTPLIQTGVAFTSLMYGGTVSGGSVRYTASLNDGTTWFIYLTSAPGSSIPTLTLASPQQVLGDRAFSGTVQIAKSPSTVAAVTAQGLYDATAGTYATTAILTGSAKGANGSYTLSWTKAGTTSKKLLMFALPHHVSSLSSTTRSALQSNFQLQTTTKGLATAILADSWTLEETLPTSLGFAPWSAALGSQTKLPANAIQLINSVAATELGEDMAAQTDLNSAYYAGKALAKFASIVYATNSLGHATGVASAGLAKLKVQYARWVNNTQIFPFVYDSAWGGVVSSASYVTGDDGVDFGNTYYNDHHFHYGYFVYAGAVIGHLDPTWLHEGTNKAWVNSLVRDYANSVSNDGYFPFSRMFDWYHGHSWAEGLFESFDGKNQESSSEDAFASYAMKLWGRTIGDANMEARGNLMLAVQARSLNDYYLLQSTNTIEPPSFLPNKVGGILFENKQDHTTFFGTNIEYIEGIHMLPLNPSSALTRNATFVSQEWDTYFSNGRVDSIVGGWRGILYANLALIDARSSYNFFAQAGFDPSWLDGGASRTWYLALAAGLGGAS